MDTFEHDTTASSFHHRYLYILNILWDIFALNAV